MTEQEIIDEASRRLHNLKDWRATFDDEARYGRLAQPVLTWCDPLWFWEDEVPSHMIWRLRLLKRDIRIEGERA